MHSSQNPPFELPTRSALIRVVKADDPGRRGDDEWPTENAIVTVIITERPGDFDERPTSAAEICITVMDLPPAASRELTTPLLAGHALSPREPDRQRRRAQPLPPSIQAVMESCHDWR